MISDEQDHQGNPLEGATAILPTEREDGRGRRAQRTSAAIVHATHVVGRVSAKGGQHRVVGRRVDPLYLPAFDGVQLLYAVALEDDELARAIAARLLEHEVPEGPAKRMVQLLIGGIPKDLVSHFSRPARAERRVWQGNPK